MGPASRALGGDGSGLVQGLGLQLAVARTFGGWGAGAAIRTHLGHLYTWSGGLHAPLTEGKARQALRTHRAPCGPFTTHISQFENQSVKERSGFDPHFLCGWGGMDPRDLGGQKHRVLHVLLLVGHL